MAGFSRSVSKTTSKVGGASLQNIRKLFAEAQELYAPGGEYMAGTEAGLKRGQKRSVATGMQNLAAAGLAGTSMVGNLGQMYEEEVGAPTRARANTARLGALSGLLQAEAGAEANLATRISTSSTTSPYYGGGVSRPAPKQSSTGKAVTATQAERRPPTLSAFPSLTKSASSKFGSDFFARRKANPPLTPGTAAYKTAMGPKSSGSFYSDYLGRGGTPNTGLKGLDPYNISSVF